MSVLGNIIAVFFGVAISMGQVSCHDGRNSNTAGREKIQSVGIPSGVITLKHRLAVLRKFSQTLHRHFHGFVAEAGDRAVLE